MQMNLGSTVKWLALILLASAFFVLLANAPYAEAQSSARLAVLQSDANRIVLELEVSGFDARETRVGGELYALYSIADLGHTSEPGNPQLPLKGAMVAIPPGAQATLRILSDETQTSAAPRAPMPAPTLRPNPSPTSTLPAAPIPTFAPNAAMYAALYPSVAAKIGTTGNWRSQHYLTVDFFPLQYNGATRQLILHRRARVEIALSYPRGQSPITLGGAVNEGAFESTFEKAFINYSSARNWRSRSTGLTPPAPSAPRTSSVCPNGAGPCYRVGVDTDGMYKVACNQLTGVPPSIDPTTLQMFKNGTEMAIKVVGTWGASCTSGDYVEFFGKGLAPSDPSFKYTNTNVYWLTYNLNPGLRMSTRDGSDPGGATAATTLTKTVRIEQNYFYRPGIPFAEADHWYWTLFINLPSFDGVDAADYPFTLDAPAAGTYTATLQVVMQSYAAATHQTITSMNGTQIDNTTWGPGGEHITTIPFTQSLMTTTNTIHLYQPSADSYVVDYFNYFTLTYASAFSATNNVLRFQQPISNSWLYTVTNFATNIIGAFDVTDSYNVTEIINGFVSGGGPYALHFADNNASPRDFIALTAAGVKTPTSVTLDAPSILKNTSNSADYVIIAASSFTSSVQSLTTLRSGQFARPAKLIDVQDVYDEFNDGVTDPKAIHDFLQYAYTNWVTPSVSYVLLVGAGNFDPKGYCAAGCFPASTSNAISTPVNSNPLTPYLKMVDPYLGEAPSDNCLVSFGAPDCSLASHTMPYMQVGRLPADSATDVTALANKIIAYENPPAGTWRWTSSFVTANTYGSDGSLDVGGNFWFFSDEIVGNPFYYPVSFAGQRIYYNPCDPNAYPQCSLAYMPPYTNSTAMNSAVLSAINSGRVIVNYVGHGAKFEWASRSGETFFQYSDLSSLSNGNKTPVMLELTCNTGYYIYPLPSDPTAQSLAKSIVNLAGKGAVASWAATGLGLVTGHDLLEKGFFNSVMNQNQRRLGPATTAGKLKLVTDGGGGSLDLLDTIVLFGDPATTIAVQFRNNYFLPLINR